MTIKDYLDDVKKLDDKFRWSDGSKYSEMMTKCTSIWDNDACRGYLIVAAKRLKMSDDKIISLIRAINIAFDDLTQDEAAKVYIDF